VTPAWLRPRAEADLIDKTRYYRTAGGDRLGERFFDAALASLRSVERMPGIGSALIGEMCDVPGLRSWPVKGFPVRWYYFVTDEHLDVVRLLADAQDLPALLRGVSDP
jgi:toxin ParE1/3/4